MTRTTFYTASTLDGYLADGDDSLEWLFAVPDAEAGTAGFPHFLKGIGAVVMGSATYEWLVGHEDLEAHPERWAASYGDRPAWVFTSRDLPLVRGAGIRFSSGAVGDVWADIRTAAGDRDVWIVGGGDLAGQFADAGLLDELVVTIAPATLGAGKPLLPRVLGSDRLRLASVRQVGPFAELVYAVTPVG